MHSRFTTVISVLLLASASLGQQQTSHEEETIVRTAYAKLSYADEVRIVLDALEKTGRDKLWKSPANFVDRALSARLNFELSDFHFGNLNDIAKRKMSDFDGSPTQIGGQVLDVTPSIYNYARKGSNSKYVAYVKFAWKQSPLQSLLPAENWPIEKALQVQDFEGKKYNSYVTYTVTVTYQGQSRTYDTWMLYGRDDRGKPQIYFMDSVADPTAVTFAFEHSLYPAAFVETDLRSVPFVDKWLYDNALSCSAKHSEKDDDRIDVCCDPKSGRCDVAASSLVPRDSRLQLKPGSQLVPASFHFSPLPLHAIQSTPTDLCQQFNQSTTFPHGLSDIQEHSVGAHTFTATVVGNCAYTDQTDWEPRPVQYEMFRSIVQ